MITIVVVALVAAGFAGLAGAGADAWVLAALCALASLAIVTATAIAQVRENTLARILTWALAVAAWALLVVLATGHAPSLALPSLTPGWVAVLAVAAVIAAALTVACLRTMADVRRRSLSHGGRLAPSISGALATIDLALLYDVLLARRWMGVEGVRSVRGAPRGPLALAYSSAVRVLRSPQALIVLAGSVVLPYALAATDIGIAIAFVSALSCFLAGLGLLSGVRVLTRSASLLRAFPHPDWVVRLATLAVPGVLIVAAGIAASPVLSGFGTHAWLLGLACGVSGLASAVRWVTGRPPDYSRPLVSTPAGSVPTNLYGSALRGFDILVLTVAPMLLWPDARGVEVSVGLSAITIAVLVGRE
ncbi:MAG: hypothetical protein EOO74_02630 [Myxococcales bacterium]|nr:MAG: hypothetical protein EOO74_02630 [Myxococcales bacterium]